MTKNTKPTTVAEVLARLAAKQVTEAEAWLLIAEITGDSGGVVARISESGLHLFVKDSSWPLATKKDGGSYRYSLNMPVGIARRFFGDAETLSRVRAALGIKAAA